MYTTYVVGKTSSTGKSEMSELTDTAVAADKKVAELAAKVESLEHAIGALITCLVRVGIEGRAISVNDSEVLGLPLRAGRIGIPKEAATILRRYAQEASNAERG